MPADHNTLSAAVECILPIKVNLCLPSADVLAPILSARLQAYVRSQLEPDDVQPIFDLLTEAVPEGLYDTADGVERVQAAILLFAQGDTGRFLQGMVVAYGDWRDILVAGGLAYDGWAERLNAALCGT